MTPVKKYGLRLALLALPLPLARAQATTTQTLNVSALTNEWKDPGAWDFPQKMLWTENGPYFKDARQNRIWDCWLPAALSAVAYVSPDWITHLLYFTDGSSMTGQWFPTADSAIVQIWNPQTGYPQNFTVNIANESPTEDRPGQAWWPSAFTQAFRHMASIGNIKGIWPNGGLMFNNGDPAVGLAMITGIPVVSRDSSQIPIDDWFAILGHGSKTPVVITTKAEEDVKPTKPDQIHGGHAYAIMYTNDYGNGNRTLTVRNPWGYTEVMDASGVYASAYTVGYLSDMKELHWGQ